MEIILERWNLIRDAVFEMQNHYVDACDLKEEVRRNLSVC